MLKRQVRDLPTSYDYAKAEASLAKPAVVRDEINRALKAPGVWTTIEPYVKPPGVTGSKYYDQANAVIAILEWDEEENDGVIASFGLDDRAIWKYMYKLFATVFQVSQGRVMGLLEYDDTDVVEEES